MTATRNNTCARLKAEVRPFRPVVLQLLRTVGDSSVPFARVAGLVQTDPVLAMELLKIANSPLFPTRMEIRSVMHAIVFLGADTVNALLLTTCLRSLAGTRSSRFIVACWRHNLATALICQRLSGATGFPEANGYTAGLIHDIGQLALLSVFPAYEKALVSAEERETDFLGVERALFGLDHGEAGRWLLAQWGCPLVLQNVAARHEDPLRAQAPDGNLIRLVHSASALANLMGMSVIEPARCKALSEIAAALPEASSQLTTERFGALTDDVVGTINSVEVSLGFHAEGVTSPASV